MWNKLRNDRKNYFILLLIACMISGLFISRALLSAAIIVFVIASFFHNSPAKQIKVFFSSPLLWAMSLLFFLPFISGLWSSNLHEWSSIIRIKLPLFFLPLAFASPVLNFSKFQWRGVFILLILLVTASSLWSFANYFTNMQAINEGYLRAQTIRTPLENDHVRFSLLVAVSILISVVFLIKFKGFLKWQKIALALIALWLIVYLHLLAARTGLLCFYAMVVVATAWMIGKQKIGWRSLILLSGIIILPVLSWFIFPTFQNRVHYFLYEFSFFKNAQYLPGSNDGVRLLSIKAGWHVMKAAPAGVGFGDIMQETGNWYHAFYPQMLDTDKIYPASEWMIYGAGTGWIGLVLFLFAMAVPFFLSKFNCYLSWILLNLSAVISFMFDIGLEVQLGVFLYAFIILWFYTGIRNGFFQQRVDK
jgi:O-Antigen ligase.